MAEFIMWLSEVRKYSHSTITGYLTAVASVVRLFTGIDLATLDTLHSLIKSLCKDRITTTKVPSWDLSVVLKALQGSPFEPLDKCPLTLLSHKTAFLLMLALGSRRGEIHALTVENYKRDPDWKWITLFPHKDFIAKTQVVYKGPKTVKGITVFSLGEDHQDSPLCPVRALKYYLDKTESFRNNRKRLFIPIKKGLKQELHRNTISFWIKKCVSEAYSINNPGMELEGVRAHDVRGYAASWAFNQQVALESILQACTWKSANSFTTFYLKDMTAIQDNMFTLGPVMAAGNVVGN